MVKHYNVTSIWARRFQAFVSLERDHKIFLIPVPKCSPLMQYVIKEGVSC